MKILITGGLGFIGSHLAERLNNGDNEIVVIDSLLNPAIEKEELEFNGIDVRIGDLSDLKVAEALIDDDIHTVYHLAANYSVPLSSEEPVFDFKNTFLTTLNVLDVMRRKGIPKIVFTSSSTVYGKQETFPIKETAELKPVSNYGAAKIASEAYIMSFSKLYRIDALILRLANILGTRSNHGIVPDFVKKLKEDKDELEILGDGKQRKSYLHIDDCLDAMLFLEGKMKTGYEIYNIGSDQWISVDQIAKIICDTLGLEPKYTYTGGELGWAGDVKEFLLDISKLKSLGWSPKNSTEEAIKSTTKWCEDL